MLTDGDSVQVRGEQFDHRVPTRHVSGPVVGAFRRCRVGERQATPVRVGVERPADDAVRVHLLPPRVLQETGRLDTEDAVFRSIVSAVVFRDERASGLTLELHDVEPLSQLFRFAECLLHLLDRVFEDTFEARFVTVFALGKFSFHGITSSLSALPVRPGAPSKGGRIAAASPASPGVPPSEPDTSYIGPICARTRARLLGVGVTV